MARCLLLTYSVLLAAAASGAAAPPNSWTAAPSMQGDRYGAAVVMLVDGRVLAAGGTKLYGRNTTAPSPLAELFRPTPIGRAGWIAAGSPRELIPESTSLVRLRDGRVLALGVRWQPQTTSFSPSAARFDPRTPEWASVAAPANLGSAVALADGRVLLVVPGGPGFEAATTLYDPARDVWTTPAPTGGASGPLVRLKDDRVVALGGTGGTFDPRTGAWAPIKRQPLGKTPRHVLLLPSGMVVAVGLGFVDLYKPSQDEWIPWIRDASFAPDAVVGLRDGRVLTLDTRSRLARLLDPVTRRSY